MTEVSPKRINAGEMRLRFMEDFFRKIGIKIVVLYPNITNDIFDQWIARGFQLFYIPSSKSIPRAELLAALGVTELCAFTDNFVFENIVWENVGAGYWFWAEVGETCPRREKTRREITSEVTLPSLEEYVIAWHAWFLETGGSMDIATWCFLRTKYKKDMLYARGWINNVLMGINSRDELALKFASGGGRAMELF